MKLKSKSLLYVLLVSAVAGITGCKPNSSKDELDVKTNGTDLTTTVKFYTNLYDKDPEKPTESKMMDEIIADFNKIYPNIKIEYEKVGQYAAVNERITNELSTPSQLPNMAVCYPDYVVNYFDSGKVLDMDKYMNNSMIGFGVQPKEGSTTEVIEDSTTKYDDFNKAFLAEGQKYIEEGTYSLPWYKNSEALFYNADVLDRVLGADNYSLTNWEDLLSTARTLLNKKFETELSVYKVGYFNHEVRWKKGEVTPIGYDSLDNMYITFSEMMNVPYGGNKDENGNGVIDKAEAVKFCDENGNPDQKVFNMVKMLKSWYDEGIYTTSEMLDSEGKGNYGVWNVYDYNQECFIYINGSKNAWYGSQNSFRGKVIGTPSIDDGLLSGTAMKDKTAKSKAMSQGANIVFFDKDNDSNIGAWLFYKFLTNSKNSAKVAEQMSSMPVRTSSYNEANLTSVMSSKDAYPEAIVRTAGEKKEFNGVLTDTVDFTPNNNQSTNYTYLQANVYDIYKQYSVNEQTFVAPVSQFSYSTRSAVESMMKNILRSEKTGTELDNLITSEIKEAYKNI